MALNEDNVTGYHSHLVHTGLDRGVTGGNDAPMPIDPPQLVASAKKAAKTLVGQNSNTGVSGSMAGSGGINIHVDDHSVFIDNSVHHSGVADGLAFFGAHWKEIAIVAGAAAMIYAIAKMIKALNKSIKIRYNKVVRTLQRAQKDFTLKEEGLNMKSVLPGVGSGIFDWISRTLTGNWKSAKHHRGNIGLHPFCNAYIEEIAMDYKTATDAFSKIKLGADGSSVDDGRNTDEKVNKGEGEYNSYGQKKKNGGSNESVGDVVIYSSFREAYSTELLNEGVAEEKVNESVLALVMAGVSLATLAVRAGTFLYQRYKDGKPVGDPKKVAVTKESTREICYAIINNYADKYVNMKQVFKEIGIDTNSLADINASDCDKLAEILKKYQKPEKNSYTKQYERIEKAYRKMLGHYYAIGNGIIANFVKYSEAKDEKHANLIVASKEKLENMWDSQKDFYDNNFSHVIIEIVSSEAYIQYLNFILDRVIPVFKTGLASDADYVLGVQPRKGEYYLLRQTGNGQAMLGDNEVEIGNVAIAEVVSCDPKNGNMKFKLTGLVKGTEGDNFRINDDGVAELSTDDIDYDAYKEKGEIDLPYNKWMSLDPVLLDWTPDVQTGVFFRIPKYDNSVTQFVYATADRENETKGYNTFIVVMMKNRTRDPYEILSLKKYKINNFISESAIYTLFTTDKSLDPLFAYWPFGDRIKNAVKSYQGDEPKIDDVETTDGLIKALNERSAEEAAVRVSDVYDRQFNDGENDIRQYVYAYGDKDDKDEFNSFVIITTKNDSKEILSRSVYKIDNYMSADDLNEFMTQKVDPQFTQRDNYNDSELKKYADKYGQSHPLPEGDDIENVGTTDKLIEKFNAKDNKKPGVKYSNIYKRSLYSSDQYIYASGDTDGEHEYNVFHVVVSPKNVQEIREYKSFMTGTYFTDSDLDSLLINKLKFSKDSHFIGSSLQNKLNGIFKNSNEPKPIKVKNIDILEEKINMLVYNDFIAQCVKIMIDECGVKMNNNEPSQFDIVSTEKDGVKIFTESSSLTNVDSFKVRFEDLNVEFNIACSGKNTNNILITRLVTGAQLPSITMEKKNWNVNAVADTMIKTFNKNVSTSEKPTVEYSYNTDVNESLNQSNVNVTRRFDIRMRNWFVISEAVYDNGSGKKSKLDESSFIKKILDRSDCTAFAKSSKLAKFMKYEINQNYNLVSEASNTPSVATPLYESLVLVKFDKLDNVVEKISLGKHRIG